MVEDATTHVDEELEIGPTSEQVVGGVVGSDALQAGIFNNAQYIIINGGAFYDVRGNVSHVAGFSAAERALNHSGDLPAGSDHIEFATVTDPSDSPTQSSQLQGRQRTYHRQNAIVAPFGNFVGWPASSGSPWCDLSGDQKEKITFIVKQLTVVFKRSERRQRLLACRATQVQMLLEFFRSLLDNPELDSYLRRKLAITLRSLSERTHLYPKCFDIGDIELIGDDPIIAGSFADIYKARFKDQIVCLKMVRVCDTSQVDYATKLFSHDAILWGQLSHPNLLPFYGLYHFRARACLVSPWVNNGHVIQFLLHNPDVDRVLLALDVAAGIGFLHAEGIIHGNLRGENILVNSSGRACLADPGLFAKTDSTIAHWTSQSSVTSKVGPARWQAPELNDLENDNVIHDTTESDVYAWSCVCYEIFTGCYPFCEVSRDSRVMWKVSQGHYPSRPSATAPWTSWGLTQAVWELMESCWKKEPGDRPVIGEIIAQLNAVGRVDDRPSSGWMTDMSPSYFRNIVSGGQQPSLDDIDTIFSDFRLA